MTSVDPNMSSGPCSLMLLESFPKKNKNSDPNTFTAGRHLESCIWFSSVFSWMFGIVSKALL